MGTGNPQEIKQRIASLAASVKQIKANQQNVPSLLSHNKPKEQRPLLKTRLAGQGPLLGVLGQEFNL